MAARSARAAAMMGATGRRAPRRAPVARPAGGNGTTALSRERIVGAALDVVAAEGLTGFSARKLGLALGCEAMSVYHHFPSKRHLMDALVDRALADIPPPPPGLSPLDRLRHLAHAYRAMANRYPQLFPLIAVHRLNTPAGVRLIERALGLVRAVVADDETAARHFRTLGYYLTGASLDETAGYAKGPSAAEPVSGEFIARECPRLAAAAPYFQPAHWAATFTLGLEALLAGMAAASVGPATTIAVTAKPVIHPKR
jgi:AcrR family transcriptional regulator